MKSIENVCPRAGEKGRWFLSEVVGIAIGIDHSGLVSNPKESNDTPLVCSFRNTQAPPSGQGWYLWKTVAVKG